VAQAQKAQQQQQQEALVRGLDALGAALTDDAVNGVCVAMLRNAVPGMSSRATASSSSSSSSSLTTAGAAAGYRRGIAEGDPPPVKRVRTESAGQDGSDGDHTHPADDSEGPDEEGSEEADPNGGAKAIRTVLKAFSDALIAASRTQPSVSTVPPDDAVHPTPAASASSAAAAAAAAASSSSASLTSLSVPAEAGDTVPVKVAPLIRIVSESPTAATSGADETLHASETGIESGKADELPLVGHLRGPPMQPPR
jgi:hypothetical protein